MKNLVIIFLALLGVAGQAQNDFDKVKAAYLKLGLPCNESIIKDDLRIKATYEEIRLCVYIEDGANKNGITMLNRNLGQWAVVAEIAKGHTQTYVTNPKTGKRMVYYSHFIPQRLVPDIEGYAPTFSQYKKLNYYDQQAATWGFLIYKNATSKTKAAIKARK